MKWTYLLLLMGLCSIVQSGFAQSDSLGQPHYYTHRDTVYLARLNSSGNLMIAAGVGLCGASVYLFYEASKIYGASTAGSSTPADDEQRNHRQGILYYAGGALAIAGGGVLLALGAKNKIEFKRRYKIMTLQSGILDNGHLGLALNF
jgi:hypothetical protein